MTGERASREEIRWTVDLFQLISRRPSCCALHSLLLASPLAVSTSSLPAKHPCSQKSPQELSPVQSSRGRSCHADHLHCSVNPSFVQSRQAWRWQQLN